MATGLIETLNRNAHLTPDQIASKLADKFSEWRLCKHVTQEEWDNNQDLRHVLLHWSYHNRPDRAEDQHILRNWQMDQLTGNWLGSNFYIRSLESYRANPSQVVDLSAELCCRDND